MGAPEFQTGLTDITFPNHDEEPWGFGFGGKGANVHITEVEEGGFADKAGVQPKWVVVKIDGEPCTAKNFEDYTKVKLTSGKSCVVKFSYFKNSEPVKPTPKKAKVAKKVAEEK